MQDDGYNSAVNLLRAHSVELLGTLEVINQQAPLYAAKHDIGDVNREQTLRLLTDLSNRVSKLDVLASKIMTIVFTGDPNESPNDIQAQGEQSNSNTGHEGSGVPPTNGSSTNMGDPNHRSEEPRDTLPGNYNGGQQ